MGTRSRIAVMHGDVCKSVYCHWDGYYSNNGKILLENFDSSKANNLVALGDMSSLRPEIGEAHPFSFYDQRAEDGEIINEWHEEHLSREEFDAKYGNMCTFYGRDRGEKNTAWKVSHSFFEFMDQCENCDAEYFYVMKDDVWYAGSMYGVHAKTLRPLSEIMAEEKVEA